MLIATRCAEASSTAPVTRISISRVAPSPSRTTSRASCPHRSFSAEAKACAPGDSHPLSAGAVPPPVAKASTVSEVEVSPSTVMQEKLCRFAASSISCKRAGATAASVKMKPSIVAMSGAIMPEPFMMPTRGTRTPPIMAWVTAALAKVSVVPIAAVAAAKSALPSAPCAAATPASALSAGSGTPITPVEAWNTSSAVQPISRAASAPCASAAARPASPVKALLFPAFTTSARARPPPSRARHSSTSGDGQRERVVTPATDVPRASSTSSTSARVQAL